MCQGRTIVPRKTRTLISVASDEKGNKMALSASCRLLAALPGSCIARKVGLPS